MFGAGHFKKTDKAPALPPVLTVKTADGACEFTVDTTNAPQFREWAQKKLAPAVAAYYPKIVAMLPGDGFTAPKKFNVIIKPHQGVADTVGTRVTVNTAWLANELDGDGIGAVIHEDVHVVQQYGHPAPGWLVEGMADYIRFFKFEPERHGADMEWLKKHKKTVLNYDKAYRVTANFLDYVVQHYDPKGVLIQKLNDACRRGVYTDDLWKDLTGKALADLNDEWKAAAKKELGEPPDAPPLVLKTADGSCEITIDTAGAPEMQQWAADKLGPALAEWYVKLSTMLHVDGVTPPKKFKVEIKPDNGVAGTVDTNVVVNSEWLSKQMDGDGLGAVVHEEVHVVQGYGHMPQGGKPAPGWLVEGMADYFRFFKFEPERHGADDVWLAAHKKTVLNYDKAYRVTANFLDYVVRHYDPEEKLIQKLNAACRNGVYTDDLWKKFTGKTLQELNDEWKTQAKKVQDAAPAPEPSHPVSSSRQMAA